MRFLLTHPMRNCALRLLTTLLLATALTSCFFTGVESTPRITQKDVNRSMRESPVTPEQQFAQQIIHDRASQWEAGKMLLVTDSRLSIILDYEKPVNHGDTLRYVSMRPIVTVTGDTATQITFATPAGDIVSYTTHLPEISILNETVDIDIPFTIDLDLVRRASQLLVGKSYYITSTQWLNDMGSAIDGVNFTPVTITDVKPGSADYPLLVSFRTDDGTQPATASVLMTAGDRPTATRNFDRLFTFDDPHLRYPQITDATWQLIRRHRLAEGMTKDEARLAVGQPTDVKKRQDGSCYYEYWIFDNGAYLNFIDGVLSTFRQ